METRQDTDRFGQDCSANQAIGECQLRQNRVCKSRYSFSCTWFGISFPEMVKWMFEIGTNLCDDNFHLTLSTVSERLICVCSSSAKSSSVVNFWQRRRFGRCSILIAMPALIHFRSQTAGV